MTPAEACWAGRVLWEKLPLFRPGLSCFWDFEDHLAARVTKRLLWPALRGALAGIGQCYTSLLIPLLPGLCSACALLQTYHCFWQITILWGSQVSVCLFGAAMGFGTWEYLTCVALVHRVYRASALLTNLTTLYLQVTNSYTHILQRLSHLLLLHIYTHNPNGWRSYKYQFLFHWCALSVMPDAVLT